MNKNKVFAVLLSIMLCALLVACGNPEAPAETQPTTEVTQPVSSTESDLSKGELTQDELAEAPLLPENQLVTNDQVVPGVVIEPTEGTTSSDPEASVGTADGNTSSSTGSGTTSSGAVGESGSAGSVGEIAPVEPIPAPQPGVSTEPADNPNQTQPAPGVPDETITAPAEDPTEPTQSPDLEDYELPMVPAF